MESELGLSDFIAVLDAPVTDVRVARLVRELGLRKDVVSRSVYLESVSAGVALLSKAARVESAFFFGDGKDGFSQWRGSIASGVTLDSTRAEVRQALGKPSASGAALNDPPLAHGGWDRFDYAAHTLHFTYDMASEQVVLVTLSRR